MRNGGGRKEAEVSLLKREGKCKALGVKLIT